MCGIVGAIGMVNPDFDLESLVETLGHRGPDAQKLESVEVRGQRALFGHTRLAINDLSDAGEQPMWSRDGRWLLVFNGEIYNHKELRQDLRGSFRGHSDTETLVECLAQWGLGDTLRRLNGIFAFAACDLVGGVIHLVRDPFGVKPVYFHCGSKGFCFASEVRALKRISGLETGLNQQALHSFLALRFTPSPQTLFEGVDRLRPGCALHYDCTSRMVTETRYIKPSSDRFTGTMNEAVEAYHEVLGRAVRRQLLSDVPLGVFLSGGIDSALVAALGCDAGADLTAFTVGFGNSYEECEIAPAAQTAQILGMPQEHVLVDQAMCWDAITPAITHVEEPLGTTSILPMWYLSALAGAHVKAVLTGQGSDEPWGGYRRYQGALIADYLPKSAAWTILWHAIGPLLGNPESLERAMRSLTARDEVAQFMEIYAMFSESERSRLAAEPPDGDLAEPLRDWLQWLDATRVKSRVERMMGIDCRMNLSDDLLLYGDKISMAASLEARVPILDLEVVSFIESLPRKYRMGWRQTKIVHKRMAQKFLPSKIINRPKLGFQVPVDEWLRGAWGQKTREVLLENSKLSSILNQEMVRQILDEHQSGRKNYQRQIFALIGLSVWATNNL